MSSIGVLGFIVWAQLGLHFREIVVIKLRYMLETTSMINSLFCKMLIPSIFMLKVQSAGNNSVNYSLTGLLGLAIIETFLGTSGNAFYGAIGSSETTREVSAMPQLLVSNSERAAGSVQYSNGPSPGDVPPSQAAQTACVCGFERVGGRGATPPRLRRRPRHRPNFSSPSLARSAAGGPHWFEDWLVGFVEGDGGFYVDINSKRFFFKIRQKNPQILYRIRDFLAALWPAPGAPKFGSVIKNNDGYYTFSVQDRNSIKRLLSLFNGKLLLNKTNKQFLNNWVINYNCWFEINGEHFVYKEKPVLNNLTFFNNAWLCGFTDSDGSFGFKLLSDSTRVNSCGKRLRVYWYVDQVDEIETLTLIKDILGFGRLEKKYPSPSQFPGTRFILARRLITDSVNHCIILRNYFDKFNPQTTKLRIRWIRWKRILGYFETGDWKNRLDEIRHLINLNRHLS